MLAWMDLEMTGLDPGRHVIVEIATLLTDDDLELIAEGPDLVVHATPEQLAQMDDVVVSMHTRSGLLPEIQASTITLEEAGAATLAFLKEHIPEPRTVPLCGNSIGTDRRFLAAYLPEIENYLHYRSVDVSTLKELMKRWNPALLDKAPRKAEGHRALDDIRESLKELRYYRDAFCVLARGRAGRGSRRLTLESPGWGMTTATATTTGQPAVRPRKQEQEPASEEITEVAPGILRLQLPDRLHRPRARQHLRHRGLARLHPRRSRPALRRVVGGPPAAPGRRRHPAAHGCTRPTSPTRTPITSAGPTGWSRKPTPRS